MLQNVHKNGKFVESGSSKKLPSYKINRMIKKCLLKFNNSIDQRISDSLRISGGPSKNHWQLLKT